MRDRHQTVSRRQAGRRVPALAAAVGVTLAATLPLTLPATLGQGAATAARPSLPDLGVAEVLAVPDEAMAGSTFGVRALVVNEGNARARNSKVAYFLSRDARRSAGDRLVDTAPVPSVDTYGVVRAPGDIKVPADAEGGYHVLACADHGRRVRESREGDNCAASRVRVLVIKAFDGRLSGSLTLTDSGTEDGGSFTRAWSRSVTITAGMLVKGFVGGSRFRLQGVDDGSSYRWTGTDTTTVPVPECNTTRVDDESRTELFRQDPDSSRLRVGSPTRQLARLTLAFDMDIDRTTTLTSCGGPPQVVDDPMQHAGWLDLKQVSRTPTSVTYKVASMWEAAAKPAIWDTATGRLTLRLR